MIYNASVPDTSPYIMYRTLVDGGGTADGLSFIVLDSIYQRKQFINPSMLCSALCSTLAPNGPAELERVARTLLVELDQNSLYCESINCDFFTGIR
jgi:hypothetical protein